MSRVLLVEGTSGVGKSTLLLALAARCVREQRPLRTLLHLTQAHTYGPLAPAEDDGSLTATRCEEHEAQVAGALRWLVRAPQNERKPKLFGAGVEVSARVANVAAA